MTDLKKHHFHKGSWTIDITEFEETFDVQVYHDSNNRDWLYASIAWPTLEAAKQKGMLWIELKEAEEAFKNFN